jgi:hypothetical protein
MSISVVIPAYNEEENIANCLDRLVPQMRVGDRVVVVNNGSTDRTAEVARTYRWTEVLDLPDSEIPTDKDRPIGYIRQYGTKKCDNAIVASTDADTLPPDDWLRRIRSHFRNDRELDLVWGVAVDKSGVPLRNLSGKYMSFVGGVSGCNTAFRKSTFDGMEQGYTGWPMFEDIALVTRMSRIGKTVHDTEMRMVSDLDRTRYQTIPMVGLGFAGVVAGGLVDGSKGDFLASLGASLVGTEMAYEAINDVTNVDSVHHDDLGIVTALAGESASGRYKHYIRGLGAGMFVHHALSEGMSKVPTQLLENTDETVTSKEL